MCVGIQMKQLAMNVIELWCIKLLLIEIVATYITIAILCVMKPKMFDTDYNCQVIIR